MRNFWGSWFAKQRCDESIRYDLSKEFSRFKLICINRFFFFFGSTFNPFSRFSFGLGWGRSEDLRGDFANDHDFIPSLSSFVRSLIILSCFLSFRLFLLFLFVSFRFFLHSACSACSCPLVLFSLSSLLSSCHLCLVFPRTQTILINSVSGWLMGCHDAMLKRIVWALLVCFI